MRTTIVIGLFLLMACSNHKKLERQANRGDIQACHWLVDDYGHGYPNINDDKIQNRIVKYSKLGLALDTIQSDPNGFDRSFFYLWLAKSRLTKKEDKIYYYYKSATLGDAEAQYVVAIEYYDGHDRKVNKDSALYWYKKAAEGNYSRFSAYACKEVGNMLYTGKFVKKDTLTAIYYYKKSCACYNVYSQVSACDSVLSFYKRQKNLKDTSEIPIYSEFKRRREGYNATK